MKNPILYLIAISFLFQSCYTYKAIDLKYTKPIVGKNYKIRQDSSFVKSKLVMTNDSALTVLEGKTLKNISISNIKEIKVAKLQEQQTDDMLIQLLVLLLLGGFLTGTLKLSDLLDCNLNF